MHKQFFLNILLASMAIIVGVYTIFTMQKKGASLFQIFISNITALSWNGQFNLDFSCYLMLSGIWIMWRNKFSTSSIIFAPFAMVIGIIVFAPYLLFLLYKENGDLKKLIVGDR
ncbi:hypothetical protein GV828_02565 [Flavobacterium sp. NST-5]|uniref:DUF2834 domain-containing protein n=1 Tax=Flavobacterium ichthyis TaxID=2698827 RepID=A0ABW9ZAG1_9FLAO|nr:hypothetical protein [Flavobacterium ichthyis]